LGQKEGMKPETAFLIEMFVGCLILKFIMLSMISGAQLARLGRFVTYISTM